jgi:N-6 DNA Methylase
MAAVAAIIAVHQRRAGRGEGDTKGDLYEYMLGKIATAGQNGQFRTPPHIIRRMVELTAPKPTDVICDPAACSNPMRASRRRFWYLPRPTRAGRISCGFTTWRRTDGPSTTSGRSFCRMKRSGWRGQTLSAEEHAKNNLPDVLARWAERDRAERERPRTAQSFCVPKSDVAAAGYDLSVNRYKEVIHEEVAHFPPKQILKELMELEEEIQKGCESWRGCCGDWQLVHDAARRYQRER